MCSIFHHWFPSLPSFYKWFSCVLFGFFILSNLQFSTYFSLLCTVQCTVCQVQFFSSHVCHVSGPVFPRDHVQQSGHVTSTGRRCLQPRPPACCGRCPRIERAGTSSTRQSAREKEICRQQFGERRQPRLRLSGHLFKIFLFKNSFSVSLFCIAEAAGFEPHTLKLYIHTYKENT